MGNFVEAGNLTPTAKRLSIQPETNLSTHSSSRALQYFVQQLIAKIYENLL